MDNQSGWHKTSNNIQPASMVNKKAYIRTIEAVIAIVILLFASYMVVPKVISNPKETPYVVESVQNYVLDQVSDNKTLRMLIVNYTIGGSSTLTANISLDGIIKQRLPPGYSYSSVICMNPDCVVLPPLQTSVYMDDALITGKASNGQQVIRLVRVWFWREA